MQQVLPVLALAYCSSNARFRISGFDGFPLHHLCQRFPEACAHAVVKHKVGGVSYS